MPPDHRDRTIDRSGGHCEAMVWVNGRYSRCGKAALDVHHLLPRSRGGDVLDGQGESVHLINLCRSHHDWVHRHPQLAYAGGLTIDGQVWVDGGRVVYSGTHPLLTKRYTHEVRHAGQGG